ncbi:MAG: HAMP domain-containing sensor histidine kinase [Phaeospirillum sp.]|nr:HAMP domain-containing sensor histidine kinase [Phaeospirillum sp.]
MTASLSARLVAGALIWLVVMLAMGGGVLTLAFRNTVEQEFSHRLDAMLRAMIAATEIGPDGAVITMRPLGDPRFDQIFSGWYWQVTEPSGRQLRSRSLWDSVLDSADGGTELRTRHMDGPQGEPLLVAERDLRFPEASGPVHLLIAGDLREVREGVRRFDLLLGSALGLLGGGLVIAILIQVRFGLRPLRAMAHDLNAVRQGERDRLPEGYPREVAPLAEAMNGVLDKDAELIERARTHVGNLAHGLKTPLAIVAAEMADHPDKTVVAEQVEAMRRLIEHHLGRASAVAGAGRVLGGKVAVREVAQAIAGVLARVFADRDLAFDIDLPATAAFRGQREDLEEILGNLMENACKWAVGRIRVSGGGGPAGLTLSVEDDGPGMPPELTAEASQRGRRLDEMAPGWGLGLSIVSDLVQVNGGAMDFSRSDLGGLAVTIRMPPR